MFSRKESLTIYLLVLFVSLAVLACSMTGSAGDAESESPESGEPGVPLTSVSPTQEGEAPEPIQTLPEQRLLTFEWPDGIRVGDSDLLRLSLVLDADGKVTPTVFFEGHELLNQPVIVENLYDTHLVRAEARLDLAGADVSPEGTMMQRMLPGEPVIFSWSVSPRDQGAIRGNIWLYLRYIPMDDAEGGQEIEKLIFTQPFEIQALNFLGLGGFPARALGVLGVFVSSILGFDELLKLGRKVIRK